MADFLDRYIQTLDSQRMWTVDRVLDQARARQRDIDALVAQLAKRDVLDVIRIPRYDHGSRVASGNVNAGMRDANRFLRNLFSDSWDIDSLLETMDIVLRSEIVGLEDEINTLQKMLDTFAFYLSDGKKFDGFFIETFSDTLNLNKDLKFSFSDRDGILLTKDDYVHVDTAEGAARIGDKNSFSAYPLELVRTKINHFPVTKFDQGLHGVRRSVRAFIESKSIIGNETYPDFINLGTGDSFNNLITEGVTGLTAKGLVMDLVYDVASPSYSEIIKLYPLSNQVVEVNQIFLYEEEDNNTKRPLLDTPFELSSPKTISFEGQLVARVEIVLRQPEYKRKVFRQKSVNEYDIRFDIVGDRHKKTYIENKIPLDNPVLRKPESWFQDLAFNRFKEDGRGIITRFMSGVDNHGRASLRSNTHRDLSTALRRIKSIHGTGDKGHLKKEKEIFDLFSASESVRNIVYDKGITSFQSPDVKNLINGDSASRGVKGQPKDMASSLSILPIDREPYNTSVFEHELKYTYEIGIGNIELGLGTETRKAVYVSKPIAVDGDPGIVRISSVETPAISLNKNRNSKYISSVEYAVSNTSFPEVEENWKPILPDNQSEVIAERVILDASGFGRFRFPARVDETVYLYINGVLHDRDMNDLLVIDPQSQGYVGIRVPPSAFSEIDFLTVDYTPLGGYTEVSFSDDPEYGNLPLAYPQSNKGRGEYIQHSEGRREYSLEQSPYISKELVRDAIYNASSGLDYKPITIKFDDGNGAINLTNYKRLEQSALNGDASEYQFLHANNVITFNKPPQSNFVVVYQYIPARLRVRAVLRCNAPSFATSSIDLIQLKAKTRKPGIQRL